MGNNVTVIPKKPARQTLLTSAENIVYMPLASRYSHGIVKIGDGLNVTADGLLSVDFNSDWHTTVKADVDQLKMDLDALEVAVDETAMDVSDIDARLTDVETGKTLISVYQTKRDTGLVTVDKTVVGGINELKAQTQLNAGEIKTVTTDIDAIRKTYATTKYVDNLYAKVAMGGSLSYVFETREQFISWLDGTYTREDSFKPESLKIGDMILIEEMGVPDYWVKSKSSPMTINDFREYEAKIEIPEVKVDHISISKNDLNELQAIAIRNGRLRVGDVVNTSDFKGWIELKSLDQFKELVEYGSVVVDGVTITYDDNAVYVTPDMEPEDIQEQIVTLTRTVTELTPKVMRALITPMSAPSKTELVAVDDGNAQTMIAIGEGLSLENGVLTAGGKRYLHSVGLRLDDEVGDSKYGDIHFSFINSSNAAYGWVSDLTSALYDLLGSNGQVSASGHFIDTYYNAYVRVSAISAGTTSLGVSGLRETIKTVTIGDVDVVSSITYEQMNLRGAIDNAWMVSDRVVEV